MCFPTIWQDGDVWILGGGASINEQFNIPSDIVIDVRLGKLPVSTLGKYMSSIFTKHIIAVNTSFQLGSWIDVMMFGDLPYFEDNKKKLRSFTGLKIACVAIFTDSQFEGENIRYLQREKRSGLSLKNNTIFWCKNTGAAAINLATLSGAKRIFLLGFDMKLLAGEQHFHNQYDKTKKVYKPNENGMPFTEHLKGFPAIAKDAEKLGIEIINVSPESEIKCFKKMTLKEALSI
jgi:hypothetical protein